jgi:hypothetical protein
MGIEFIRKAAPSYTKAIDRERVRMSTAEMFRETGIEVIRTFAIDMASDGAVRVGDELVIERDGKALIARRDLVEVGRARSPRPEIAEAIAQSAGIARGIVVQVNELSGVAEVRSC